MLFAEPDILRGKIHFTSAGPALEEPYTEEQKAAFDQFVKDMKEAEKALFDWEE